MVSVITATTDNTQSLIVFCPTCLCLCLCLCLCASADQIWKVVHDDDKVKPTSEQIAAATSASEVAKVASDAAQAAAAAAVAAKGEAPSEAASAAAAAAVANAVTAANAAAAAAAAVPAESDECPDITFLSELSRHTGAVNCVRFSPNGKWLASAGDDHTILIWALDASGGSKSAGNLMQSDTEAENLEHWRVNATLRGHREDIFDLAWSPNSKRLLSGSVDNTAIVWDVADLSKVKQVQHIKDHKHFVQGVAWHPTNKCIVTQSSDRSFKVYEQSVKRKTYTCVATTTKMAVPEAAGAAGAAAEKETAAADNAADNAAPRAAVEDGSGVDGMDTSPNDDEPVSPEPTTAAAAAAAAASAAASTTDTLAKSTPTSPTAATTAATTATTATAAAATTTTTTSTTPLTLAEGKAGTPAATTAAGAGAGAGAGAAAAKPKMRSERLFVDETRTAFFRRLTFTPDGTMFIAAAGRHATEDGSEENAAYLFRSSMPEVPIVRLGGMQSPVVCARACPLYFKPKHLNFAVEQPQIFANLEHRMIFAIATADTVFLYDTEQLAPFATVAHLHYASITDLAWSADAKMLAITSQDGYCSMVAFNQGELGAVSTVLPPLMMEAPVEEVAVAEKESMPQSPTASDAASAESSVAMATTESIGGGAAAPAAAAAAADKVKPAAKKRISPTLISTTSTGAAPAKKRINPTLIASVTTGGAAVVNSEAGNGARNVSPLKNKAEKQPETTEQPKAKARRITPMLVSSSSSSKMAAAAAAASTTTATKKRIAPILVSTPTPTN